MLNESITSIPPLTELLLVQLLLYFGRALMKMGGDKIK